MLPSRTSLTKSLASSIRAVTLLSAVDAVVIKAEYELKAVLKAVESVAVARLVKVSVTVSSAAASSDVLSTAVAATAVAMN